MSFILNALRKSEEERQSTQPENLRDRIQERPKNTKKKSTLWLIILFLTNLVLLFYFVWVFILKVEPAINNESPEKTTEIKKIIDHAIAIKPTAIKTTDLQNKTNIENISIKTRANPKINEPQISITQLVENKKRPLQPIKEAVAVAKTTVQSKQPSKNSSTTSIPFLSDLSPKFRRSVPDILINVFIYVEKEEKRLIMINTKTYRVGQEISKNMKLKEIRKKSIVVKYKNKTFQIRR